MLNRELRRRNVSAHVLDIDERFIDEAGFQRFDLYRPTFQPEKFGVIICDPPFWNVSLSQLLNAIRLLSHFNANQPLAICYPTRRAKNLLRTFAAFELKPSGFFPQYESVQNVARNEIEFFANFAWESSSTK